MPQAKIKAIQGDGTFDGQHGLLYKFIYTFEDGQEISARHKTPEPPLSIGDLAEYEVRGTRNGLAWGGVRKPQDQAQGNRVGSSNGYNDNPERQRRIKVAWALGHAITQTAGDDWERIEELAGQYMTMFDRLLSKQ
jgi:hypothetical protein